MANGAAAGVEALPLTDVSQLVGLSQADTMKLFGPPAAPKTFPRTRYGPIIQQTAT